MKKISSLEYALNKAIGRRDLNKNCEPRTRQEEDEAANEHLIKQLGRMRNATTGEPLLPDQRIKESDGE